MELWSHSGIIENGLNPLPIFDPLTYLFYKAFIKRIGYYPCCSSIEKKPPNNIDRIKEDAKCRK